MPAMTTVPLLTCCFRGSTRSRASHDKDIAVEPSQEVIDPFSSDLLVDSAEGGSSQRIDGLSNEDQTQTSRVTGQTQFGDQSLHRPAGMKRKEEGEEMGGALTSNSCGYEVFLNFRGLDTRLTITDCLYEAMIRAGIRAFKDDPELRVGEKIGGSLLEAINNSKIYIPIFSKNYASSKWCLRELAHMVEYIRRRSRDTDKKVILPIFYDVDVDDVKLKTDLYRKALQKHKRNSRTDLTRKWEEALGEVAKIKGWNLKDHGLDELVKLVLEKVTSLLWTNVPDDFVGIKDRKDDIMKMLDLGVSDVRFIVIHGMGGIGKTTLADAVFRQIFPQFQDHCCFLKDVRSHDIFTLQKILLSKMLNLSCTNLSILDEGTNMIKKRFKGKKVLIILDDIDKPDQIERLVGHADWFGEGSRIIITTRNIDFLVTESEDDNSSHYQNFSFYNMPEMNWDDALQLFCERALRLAKPPPDYVDISYKLIDALGRLPLALNVTGSTLRGKSKNTWEEFLQRLKKVINKDVKEKLMISYEALDFRRQQIYLDIACFFINEEKATAIKYWDAIFEYSTGIDVKFLTHMSLIKINDDRLWMHDQLRDLGRDIVHPENNSGDQRGSRLWRPKDAFHAVKRKKGTENVVALNLGTPEPDATYIFKPMEFVSLVKLRFLQLDRGNFEGDFKDLFSELRWLSWSNCPSELGTTTIGLQNLVVLELSGVNITTNWGGWRQIMVAKQLKVLTLENCPSLIKTPKFSTILGLERLILANCTRLIKIDKSIRKLQHLDYLKIQSRSLLALPNAIGNLTKVKHLILQCQMLQELPNSIGQLESLLTLTVKPSKIKKLPHSIGNLERLEVISIVQCPLTRLPDSIGGLQSLVELYLYQSYIMNLPNSIGNLKKLKKIHLGRTRISELPNTIGMLKNLEELIVYPNLKVEIPSEIGDILSLRILKLPEGKFSRLPTTINQLTNLQELYLFDCDSIQQLPELPKSLTKLSFSLTSVTPIPDLSNLTNLVYLCMRGWPVQVPNIEWLVRLGSLRSLILVVKGMTLPPIDLRSLSQLKVLRLSYESEFLIGLPCSLQHLILDNVRSPIYWSLFSNLENLVELALLNYQLQEIQFGVLGKLRKFNKLRMESCPFLKKLPVLPCLKEIQQMSFVDNPQLTEIQGLGELKSLRSLYVRRCNAIRRLPETDLSHLQSLSSLEFRECKSLESLPNLPNMKTSCHLTISECPRLSAYSGPYRLYRDGEIL